MCEKNNDASLSTSPLRTGTVEHQCGLAVDCWRFDFVSRRDDDDEWWEHVGNHWVRTVGEHTVQYGKLYYYVVRWTLEHRKLTQCTGNNSEIGGANTAEKCTVPGTVQYCIDFGRHQQFSTLFIL